jgi:lipopolysaccharide export system protein LptA
MKIHKIILVLYWALLVQPFVVFAENSAATKSLPVFIEAGQVVVDETKGVSVYSGSVRFQHGAMELLADNVKVYSDGRQLSKVVADGKPVKFFYRGVEADQTEAQAGRMEYIVADARLIMTGEAQLWQGSNHFSGGRIEFDTENDRVLATRSDQTSQPVRVIIHPGGMETSAPESVDPKSGVVGE